jgi:GntR family transcriptional regulator
MTVGYLPNTATWGNASHEPPRDGLVATSDPVYLRVVEDIRRQILDGTLPPGALIPSRAQLTRKYQVGETAARHALRTLANEGLIVGRIGSGHYVKERSELIPLHRWRFLDLSAPFAADLQSQGRRVTWDWYSEPAEAGPDIARRLRVDEKAMLTKTHYVFRGDGQPLQLATAYELMEFAPFREEERRSLVSRMYAHGVKITEVVESVHTRAPHPDESEKLQLSVGVHVLHVERTHWAGDRPVETSDIVLPGDRFRMVYSMPV